MKKSIKFKFTLGLSLIFLISGIGINILMRKVFEVNLENTIKSSVTDIMNNSRDYIHYRFLSNNLPFNDESLDSLSFDILYYFTSTHNCDSQVRNKHGQIIQSNISKLDTNITKNLTEAALEGMVIINLQYGTEKAYVTFAYPLYYEENPIGILTIKKNFSELYSANRKLVNIITYSEIGILIIIFILSFILISKLINPISILTKDIKKVGEGDYANTLYIKGNDEIAVLSKEFVNMKMKIKEQIDTITKEKEKVMRLEKIRTQFFNNVTHELKTPLTGISCYAQILLEELNSEDEFKNRAINRIYMESERLHNLVLDLIDVSKGMSLIEDEAEDINMQKLLNEICDDMEIKARKHSIKLCKSIDKGYITGITNRIKQVLINIIDNAIKYSHIKEDINITTLNKDGFYTIKVCNKGDIIPSEIYENIFEPFVRSKNSSELHSNGLGLYICNEIIKKHNGEINIKNGEVIVVTIKFPSGNILETTKVKMDKS